MAKLREVQAEPAKFEGAISVCGWVRTVREGRPASGRGWIGITPRGAYVTQDLRVVAVLPGWLWLVLAASLALGAWLREGRLPKRAV